MGYAQKLEKARRLLKLGDPLYAGPGGTPVDFAIAESGRQRAEKQAEATGKVQYVPPTGRDIAAWQMPTKPAYAISPVSPGLTRPQAAATAGDKLALLRQSLADARAFQQGPARARLEAAEEKETYRRAEAKRLEEKGDIQRLQDKYDKEWAARESASEKQLERARTDLAAFAKEEQRRKELKGRVTRGEAKEVRTASQRRADKKQAQQEKLAKFDYDKTVKVREKAEKKFAHFDSTFRTQEDNYEANKTDRNLERREKARQQRDDWFVKKEAAEKAEASAGNRYRETLNLPPSPEANIAATAAQVKTATDTSDATRLKAQSTLPTTTVGGKAETKKRVTKEQAIEYLRRANRDLTRAQELATQDGYTWGD